MQQLTKNIHRPKREPHEVWPHTGGPSDSQPLIRPILGPPPSELWRKHTHSPRLGGGRILKTNKQRIDLLRRIAEVLITSDPSPLLSESASHSSLILPSIYDLTHSLSHNLGYFIIIFRAATMWHSECVCLLKQHQSVQNSTTIMLRVME